MNIVLEENSELLQTGLTKKEALTLPGTPQTAASTPQTSLRSLYFSSMNNMPKISPLDESDSKLEMAAKSPDSVIEERKTSQEHNKHHVKFLEESERTDATLVSHPIYHHHHQDTSPTGKLVINSIIGRQEEIRTLKACLQRMVTAKRSFDKAMKFDSGFLRIPSKEMVFIQGEAGVGKTTMARKLSSYVSRSKGGLFCQTKFDNSRKVPFCQMAQLFQNICKEVLASEESGRLLSDILHQELGDQKYMLLQWIPELEEIFDADKGENAMFARIAAETFDVEHAQQRWMYAFRALSRALSAVISPLVVLLDDIQWADAPSLELMNYLMSDKQNPNPFMIIGCYRCSGGTPSSSLLTTKIQDLRKGQDKFRYNVTQVDLRNHSAEDVQQMLCAMMRMDTEDTVQGLAQLCYQQTHGNAYFVLEWMYMLQQEGLLTFDTDSLIWIWDEDKVTQKIGNNHDGHTAAVDLVQARIRKLTLPAQTFLHCAAYLGSTFDKATVTFMWKQFYKQQNASAEEVIAILVDQNIVEQRDSETCYWVHDIVREGAQSLLGGSDKVFFLTEVGKILLLEKDLLEKQLFVVVNLIDQSTETSSSVECAKLYLRAARKARDIAAFESARDYAFKGIHRIPAGGRWSTHRALTVDLCTIAAMMELAMGNGNAFDEYSQMVLGHHDCTEQEAMPLLVAGIYKLGTVEFRYQDAVEDSLALLKHWGTATIKQRRMRQPAQAFNTLSKTIKVAKKYASAPHELGSISDPKLLNSMKILSHLSRACIRSKQAFLNILVICKTIELTLKHGLSEFAGPAFATLGMLAIALNNDTEAGHRFGQTALEIQERMPEPSRAETLYIVHTYCLPWSKSIKAEPFAKAHSSGMSVGRHDYALWALVSNQIMAPWMLGKSLVSLREYCPDVLSQAEEVSQTIQSIVVKIFWQAMINFSPTNADENEPNKISSHSTKLLEGEIFSASNFKGTDTVALAFVHLMQGELLLFFDIDKAADRALEFEDKFSRDAPAMFLGIMETFHRAVALYAMARKTRKRRYKQQAKILRRRIEKWLDDGNPNVKHYEIFLNAEQAALDNRVDLADTRYRRAIVYAARTGHLHHTALFNERYAQFLQDVKGDENEASHRIHEAIRFYREWGAFAKASELQSEVFE